MLTSPSNPTLDAQRVLILGTGALATLIANRLSRAGRRVHMFGHWEPGLRALAAGGARVQELEGGTSIGPVAVSQDPADCSCHQIAILLEKSWQTRQAAELLRKQLHPDGVALSLQNGLQNYELLCSALGEERAIQGATTIGASLADPGVACNGGGDMITLQDHPFNWLFAELLMDAGFRIETIADVRSLIWHKLVASSAINPLTAIFGCQNGKIADSPARLRMARDIAQETSCVATALGISTGVDDPGRYVLDVLQSTSRNLSSMLQDMQRGSPTEIDAINGAIVGAGIKVGVPTPLNHDCWQRVHKLVDERNRETASG